MRRTHPRRIPIPPQRPRAKRPFLEARTQRAYINPDNKF